MPDLSGKLNAVQDWLRGKRSPIIVILAFIGLVGTGLLTNGIVGSISSTAFTKGTQVMAFGDMITFDAIIFGFLGVIANQDYERVVRRLNEDALSSTPKTKADVVGARNFLKGDVIIAVFLIVSGLVSLYGVLISDSKLSPDLIGLSLYFLIVVITMILLRLFDLAFLA
jgi:hypothetical protein